MWKPEKRAGKWCVTEDTPERGPRIVTGGDGNPLYFWNEKSAQLRADAANKRGE